MGVLGLDRFRTGLIEGFRFLSGLLYGIFYWRVYGRSGGGGCRVS